jgi:hypothetical protein
MIKQKRRVKQTTLCLTSGRGKKGIRGMDKKLNFWQFQGTQASMVLLVISVIMGVFAYFTLKDDLSWANTGSAIIVVASYVSGCFSAIRTHNRKVAKDIKGCESEQKN